MTTSISDNLAGRMKHLLDSAKLADAYFLVGDGDEKELLSAHKGILVSASDVFEAMFRYDSKNGKAENASADNPVEVPDVEAAAFKVMLSFIYADDLSELDGDNAMAVLYAARKYNISGLFGRCLQIPIPNLSNVFLAIAQARLFDLEDFSNKCLRYICQNAGQLFESKEFLQIDQNLLCELFENNQLMINDEFVIWQAALRWADEKCRQNAIECSAENRRAALGPAVFKIRFPLIPTEDFSKSIVPSSVLTMEEFVGIYQFHCHPNFRGVPGLYPLKFPTQTRIPDSNISIGNRGTLTMEIEKFSEFSREKVNCNRYSGAMQLKGFEWKIFAKIINAKYLCIYLLCVPPTNDGNWSCKCSATIRIVAQKNGTEDLTKKIDHVFNKEENDWGFKYFITFTELMKPSKGFYDKNEDKVTLAIDLTVEEEKGIKKRKLTDE
ncbi:hypothetical protein niasHT_028451 [Heterodera trifolii]|uniref:BTB domain-containing protein n=1 Tax=Heterodera trifolii TaxID=157864 RepID=A0ABD2KRC5_9BILA